MEEERDHLQWRYGAIPLSMSETHDTVVERMEKEDREKVVDAPCGTGILADWIRWPLPLVWLIRLGTRFVSKKRKEPYRLEETLTDEIIMGGNTLIVVGEMG